MEPFFKFRNSMSLERYRDCYFQSWLEKDIANIVLGIILAVVGIIFLIVKEYLIFIVCAVCSASLIYQTASNRKLTFKKANDKYLKEFGTSDISHEMEFYSDHIVLRNVSGMSELYYAGFKTLFIRPDFVIIETYIGGIYIMRESTDDFDGLMQFLKEKCVKAKIREKKRRA